MAGGRGPVLMLRDSQGCGPPEMPLCCAPSWGGGDAVSSLADHPAVALGWHASSDDKGVTAGEIVVEVETASGVFRKTGTGNLRRTRS